MSAKEFYEALKKPMPEVNTPHGVSLLLEQIAEHERTIRSMRRVIDAVKEWRARKRNGLVDRYIPVDLELIESYDEYEKRLQN